MVPVTTDRISVAVRVLKAFSVREYPHERDIDLLRAYCPNHPKLDPDQLAQLVIRESVQNRRTARAMGASAEVV